MIPHIPPGLPTRELRIVTLSATTSISPRTSIALTTVPGRVTLIEPRTVSRTPAGTPVLAALGQPSGPAGSGLAVSRPVASAYGREIDGFGRGLAAGCSDCAAVGDAAPATGRGGSASRPVSAAVVTIPAVSTATPVTVTTVRARVRSLMPVPQVPSVPSVPSV